jgi:hypothetical protein
MPFGRKPGGEPLIDESVNDSQELGDLRRPEGVRS